MSQILNIEITNNNKVLATCYLHWSGYTNTAAFETRCIINNILKKENENKLKYTKKAAVEILMESLPGSRPDYKTKISVGLPINFKSYVNFKKIRKRINPEIKKELLKFEIENLHKFKSINHVFEYLETKIKLDYPEYEIVKKFIYNELNENWCYSFRNGIISTQKEVIDYNEYWEKHRVTIDLKEKTIKFDVLETFEIMTLANPNNEVAVENIVYLNGEYYKKDFTDSLFKISRYYNENSSGNVLVYTFDEFEEMIIPFQDSYKNNHFCFILNDKYLIKTIE